MEKTKLDRALIYELKANRTDELELWPSPFDDDRQNLTLKDNMGRNMISIYALTHEQLSALYDEIGEVLAEAQRNRLSEPR